MGTKYAEQYNRMKRWLYRVKNHNDAIYDGRIPLSVYLNDVGYSFFTCCWHLWEWIKNDDSLNAEVRNAAEGFARSSHYLKACESICIASKHCVISNKNVKKDVELLKVGFSHNPYGPGPTYNTIELFVQVGDKRDKFLNFAEKCIGEWNIFFSTHGLSVPSEDTIIHFDTLTETDQR